MKDEAAMEAVQNGDLDKLAVLFERYKSPLYSFFKACRYERDDCQELIQQVFMRVIDYSSSFKSQLSFKPWLFAIARNQHIDYTKRRKTYELNDTKSTGIFIDETETEKKIKMLEKALDALPVEFKEVLILSRFRKLKYEDIATILNCSIEVIKVRAFRGIKKLRELYLKFEAND